MSSLLSGDSNHGPDAQSLPNLMSQYGGATFNSHTQGSFFLESHHVSPGDTPSDEAGRPNVDLDLDSLFRKLDKYTAEMEEVAVRLDHDGWNSKASAPSKTSSLDLDPLYAHVFRTPPTQKTAGHPGIPHSQTMPGLQDGLEQTSHDLSSHRRDDGLSNENKLHPQIPDSLSQQSSGVSSFTEQPQLTDPDFYLSLPRDMQQPGSESMIPGLEALHYPIDVQEGFYHDLAYSDMDEDEPGPSIPTPWTHPPRSSSKPVVPEDSSRSSSPSSQVSPLHHEAVDKRNPFRQAGFWSMPTFDDEPTPPVPHLSQSGSIATLATSPPPTPLSLFSPKEDQIRRELESFAIVDGAETLELRYKKRRPPMLSLVDADDDLDFKEPEQLHPQLMGPETTMDTPRSARPRRSKSIMSIFQRKSPVEKVIDLYFDDESEVKPTRSVSRWATLSRRTSPTRTRRPTIPALPSASLHAKKFSFS